MATGSSPTILLVDDEPDILDTHARLLSHGLPGTTILRAASGEDALDQMALHPVDIVVSDLQMPGMDGMELLATSQRMDPEVYRVLVTAFPDAASSHQALKDAELEAILEKPVNPPAFIAMLQRLLSERAAMAN